MASVEVLGGGQVVLLAVVFTSIVAVQPVGQLRGERPAGGAGGQNGRGAAVLKGYPLSATLAKGIAPRCRLFSTSGLNVRPLFL